jgi:LAO/AO transport system kinase
LAHPVERTFIHHGRVEITESHFRDRPDRLPVWVPPIQRTIAIAGSGIPDLGDLIAQHRAHLENSGGLQDRERIRLQAEVENLLQETLMTRWRKDIREDVYQGVLDELVSREISPRQAVKALLNGGNP